MTILDTLGHYLSLIRMMHFKHLGNLQKLFKIRKISKLYQLGVIMGVSLKIKNLIYFVKSMALNITFLHLEPLNKMELLKGKIGLWKKLLEHC